MDSGDEREMVRLLVAAAGLKLSDQDMAVVADLHMAYAEQRSRLSGAARAETEPMTIPAFDRAGTRTEAADGQARG